MARTPTFMATVGIAATIGALTAVPLAQAPAGQAPAVLAPQGQGRGGRGQAPQTPQAQAPIALAGWWVSVVTEDWRWRMVTPPKGDYASVPLNNEGRRLADTWDPAKDERDGAACRAYGAGAIMRLPGRLHVTWQDDSTLRIDTDAGTQTRVLRFDPPSGSAASGPAPPPAAEPSWQGSSAASWEIFGGNRGGPGGGGGGGGGGRAAAGPPPPRYGSLKVVTTKMKAGYLRKNGVPYSDAAVVTEHFDRHAERNGDQWLTVTTIVEDSKYLNQPFITTSHFRKEADGSKWRPTACVAQ